MARHKTIPKSIKQNRYGKLFGQWWNVVHNHKGIIVVVITGKRGVGKSYVALKLGEILDRGPEDIDRFNIDKVCLKIEDFFKWINKPRKEMPDGTLIVLDDAGLYLYSRDALTKLIKRINKTLQNIRIVHPIIILTVPYFPILEKLSREFCDYYIEITGRDYENKENLATVQYLETYPYTGEIYRHNIPKKVEFTHPELGITVKKFEKITYGFGLPSKELAVAYEMKHEEEKRKFNIESEKFIRSMDKQKEKIRDVRTTDEKEEEIKQNWKKYWGEIWKGKGLINDFDKDLLIKEYGRDIGGRGWRMLKREKALGNLAI